MPTLKEQLEARIANLDAEIARIQADADAQVARLEADKAPLQAAIEAITKNPAIEVFFPALRKQGVL